MVKRRQAKTSQRAQVRSSGPAPDYEIGYGRPPRKSQFKPGQSGNPNGRPKGQLNLRTVVEAALQQTIEIREGDRTRPLSRFEALVITVLDKAMRGDAKPLSFILALVRLMGVTADTPEPTSAEPATAHDLEIIADFLRRHGASSENAVGPEHVVDDQQNLNKRTKP